MEKLFEKTKTKLLDVDEFNNKIKAFHKQLKALKESKRSYERIKVLVGETQIKLGNLYDMIKTEVEKYKPTIAKNKKGLEIGDKYYLENIVFYKKNYIKSAETIKNLVSNLKQLELDIIKDRKELKESLNKEIGDFLHIRIQNDSCDTEGDLNKTDETKKNNNNINKNSIELNKSNNTENNSNNLNNNINNNIINNNDKEKNDKNEINENQNSNKDNNINNTQNTNSKETQNNNNNSPNNKETEKKIDDTEQIEKDFLKELDKLLEGLTIVDPEEIKDELNTNNTNNDTTAQDTSTNANSGNNVKKSEQGSNEDESTDVKESVEEKEMNEKDKTKIDDEKITEANKVIDSDEKNKKDKIGKKSKLK